MSHTLHACHTACAALIIWLAAMCGILGTDLGGGLHTQCFLLGLQGEELGIALSLGGDDAEAGPSGGCGTKSDREAAKAEREHKRLERETDRERQRLEKERARTDKEHQKEAEREAKRAEKERGKAAKEVAVVRFVLCGTCLTGCGDGGAGQRGLVAGAGRLARHPCKAYLLLSCMQATKTGYKSKEALDKSRSFMSVRALHSSIRLSVTYNRHPLMFSVPATHGHVS